MDTPRARGPSSLEDQPRGARAHLAVVGAHAPGGGVVVSAEYSHLHAVTRPLAAESTESRIRRIRTDRWITYGRAEAALSGMGEFTHLSQADPHAERVTGRPDQ